jgi:hypothetical protein
MENHDEVFEQYLRQFRPRAPRTLPNAGRTVPPSWCPKLAVVAALIVICSFLGWFSVRRHHLPRTSHLIKTLSPSSQMARSMCSLDVSLGRLMMVMRSDPSALDAALIDLSPRLLPNVENPQGTLHVLAGE